MLQKLNHQPNPSNMNNWTISRRVIAGFAAMLLIIVTLGVFALWRLMGLAEDIAYVADNSVPSILTLREAANISRDNLILLLQIDPSNTTDRNSVLEQKISTNGARRDELIKSYESLISDAEDRQLYEEIKRTSDVARASRRRALELLKENKVDEFRKVQQEEVIPEYEKYLKAIDLDIDYNEKLAKTYADHGKKSVLFSRPLDRRRPRPRLASGIPSGMAGHSLDKPSPQGHHGQPRPGGAPDRLGGPAGIDGESKPRFRGQ